MQATTADLYDAHPQAVEVCDLQFRSFGRRMRFFGQCATLRTYENHLPILQALKANGTGRLLVVDGGGSLRVGLVGDRIAGIAVENNWAGIVIFGAIRDSTAVNQLDIGIKALGATARRGWKDTTEALEGPVEFGSVQFQPGSWIYADEDSVIVSPVELSLETPLVDETGATVA
ncbi:ribonuclease E inhibitor RraA [Pseudaminobacter arsenicus]|uniref:4-hydroxy-4-methyl-2-oxoglutarate aldolase n=2 Tax=Borborobacter arsenicus TaxID=1851146 RepID=A0A432V3K6_9HYPH|nr:ribonuclease E inhibitor RraA [Pseudaminobacter arsenicus]